MRAHLVLRPILALLLLARPAWASPAVDGKAFGEACGASSPTATLTTTGPGLVIALAGTENHFTPPVEVSSVSGAGLTWVKDFDVPRDHDIDYDGYGVLENAIVATVWHAVSPGAITAQTITQTNAATTDASGLIVFGVSGANTAMVYDPAQPCIAVEDNTGSGSLVSPANGPIGFVHVYTNAADPLEILWSITSNNEVVADPAGYSTLETFQNVACSGAYYATGSSYLVPGSQMVDQTVASPTLASIGLRGFVAMSLAICGASGGCNGPIRSQCPNAPPAAPKRPFAWINE